MRSKGIWAHRIVGIVVATLSAQFYVAAARAGGDPDYSKLVSEKSAALVTVKYLIKVSMPGRAGEESPSEASGVMIDPKGLVLCSNTQMGGIMNIMMRMMGRDMGEISAIPSDLKVLIGDDTEGIEAKLVARDSDLDLAWVQVKNTDDKKFASIDFTKNAKPAVGDSLLTFKRMGKYFDRVPVFGETKMAAITKKPRELLIPSTNFSGMGMPVFTTGGEIVGVSIMQLPESDEGSENPMGMLSSMFNMQESMAPLILPAEEVVKATKRAMEGGTEEKKEEPKEEKPKEEKPKEEKPKEEKPKEEKPKEEKPKEEKPKEEKKDSKTEPDSK